MIRNSFIQPRSLKDPENFYGIPKISKAFYALAKFVGTAYKRRNRRSVISLRMCLDIFTNLLLSLFSLPLFLTGLGISHGGVPFNGNSQNFGKTIFKMKRNIL